MLNRSGLLGFFSRLVVNNCHLTLNIFSHNESLLSSFGGGGNLVAGGNWGGTLGNFNNIFGLDVGDLGISVDLFNDLGDFGAGVLFFGDWDFRPDQWSNRLARFFLNLGHNHSVVIFLQDSLDLACGLFISNENCVLISIAGTLL